MINARSLESAILGGYADYVREHHPEAPWPGIYLADDLFEDARRYRENVGDAKFFDLLGPATADAKWGKRAVAWDAARFEAAMAAPPGDDGRGRLVGDLVKHLFQGYAGVSAGKSESFLSLDKVLRGDNLDQHAQHLSQQDRLSARLVLENQQSALESTLKQALNAAYGIAREPQPGTLDATHEPAFRSLDRSFTPQTPVGADLGSALEHLLGQALVHQYPDHPHFEGEVRKLHCEKVLAEVQRAARVDPAWPTLSWSTNPLAEATTPSPLACSTPARPGGRSTATPWGWRTASPTFPACSAGRPRPARAATRPPRPTSARPPGPG
jgi:hypothetical protein